MPDPIEQVRALHEPVRYRQAAPSNGNNPYREVWCSSECWTPGPHDPLAWPCLTALVVYSDAEIDAEHQWAAQ